MFGRARKGGSTAGWSAVEASADGIVGVSVRAPGSSGAKPQVLKCAQLAEQELDPGTLSQLAKKISAGGFGWTLPLNRGDYKIFVVPQPTVQASEMAQSVRWSLGPMLDFPVEEAAIDWMSIPTQSGAAGAAAGANQRPPHIYVIAAHRDIVAKRTDSFRKTKLALQAVDIRETAQRNVAVRLQKPDEGLGMVVLNARGVQITFTYGGELYLDRYIEEPIESLVTGDEETRERVFDRITLQVQRSVDFMNRNYPFIAISRIVVAPMPAPIPLRDYLAANVTERVETLDLARVFDFSQTPELTEEETQSRYFTALGAALRGMEIRA
jgi:MSHA biogenesis protein MshI